MMLRWIGAGVIFITCTAVGFMMAADHRKEEKVLKQLLDIFSYMECQLEYTGSTLPELCFDAAKGTGGIAEKVFMQFSDELAMQRCTDATACMDKVLSRTASLPKSAVEILRLFGRSVGKFDLDGQLRGLQHVRSQCAAVLERFGLNRDIRIRNYQTLGLCAGAALAILLI